MTRIEHKRGDTFRYSAVVRQSKTGPVIDISDWTITSMVRTLDSVLIAELDVTITDGAQGKYTVSLADTSAWPIGWAHWDIEYMDGSGVKTSTDTVSVKIIQDVTYPDS